MRFAALRRFLRREPGLGDMHALPLRHISADASHASYGMVSAGPPIFVVGHWMDEKLRFASSMEQL